VSSGCIATARSVSESTPAMGIGPTSCVSSLRALAIFARSSIAL
jgi:hypothetical protein